VYFSICLLYNIIKLCYYKVHKIKRRYLWRGGREEGYDSGLFGRENGIR